jgi:hypothetical protein
MDGVHVSPHRYSARGLNSAAPRDVIAAETLTEWSFFYDPVRVASAGGEKYAA